MFPFETIYRNTPTWHINAGFLVHLRKKLKAKKLNNEENSNSGLKPHLPAFLSGENKNKNKNKKIEKIMYFSLSYV